MGIRASFGGIGGSGIYDKPTIKWLFETGVINTEDTEQLKGFRFFDIELRETPKVLSYFSQIEDELDIYRITREGIVFYLTDIPLFLDIPEEEQRATAENNEGYLFVPMSNVICLNSFGAVIPKDIDALNS